MSDNLFFEGQDNISAIYLPTENGCINTNGENEKIIVSMEYGQMAGVPWFCYYKDGVLVSKWNAAYIEGVTFIKA